jgi:hypothetical protein
MQHQKILVNTVCTALGATFWHKHNFPHIVMVVSSALWNAFIEHDGIAVML